MPYKASQKPNVIAANEDDKPLSSNELLLLSASFSTLLGMVALVVGTA